MKSNNITEIRIEAETKLEYESRKLEDLKKVVEQSRKKTEDMTSILSVMEKRIKNLEKKLLPIHDRFRTQQLNIECTLAALDNYLVDPEMESIVRAGPGSDEESQQKFLSSVQQLRSAMIYLEKHNPQSYQLANISSLFFSVNHSLKSLFRLLLLKMSQPLQPKKLLNDNDNDESLCDGKTITSSLDPFPGYLIVIADVLATHHNRDFIRIYAQTRYATMMTSYDQVKKQHPLGKRSCVHDGLVLAGGWVGIQKWSTDESDKQEMESYLYHVTALEKLMENEQSFMTRTLPLQFHHQVFQFIISEALDSTVKDGQNITACATTSISSNGFSVVSFVLPALRWLLIKRPKFNQIVEGCEDKVRFQFPNIIKSFRVTVEKALNYKITENVRSDPSPGLPKVHEITVSVLEFLEHLVEYIDIIADILKENPAYNSSSLTQIPYDGKVDKNKVLLGMYTANVLSELNLFFTLKSNDYTDKGLRALFRIINCHHVLKALSQSHLLDLVKITQNNYLQMCSNLVTTHKKAYKQCWSKALSYIVDSNKIVIKPGKLHDADRKAVKEKFQGFNKEMEEIFSIQCKCLISDLDLRAALKRDNTDYIWPKYQTFYNKFSKLNFADHPERFVKYTPKDLAAILNQFFELGETTI